MARVVVVGGGLSGLVTAEYLREQHDVRVFDAGEQPGGMIRTVVQEGFHFDLAANGFLDNEPAALALVERLGLEDRLLPAKDGPRYLVMDGQLTALPRKPPQLLRSPLLSWRGKLRALLGDLFGARGQGEESIAGFVRRRFGAEVLETLVQPMVTGIHAGDVEALSVQACFPALVTMEREHRSLIQALRRRPKGKAPHLHSFVGGAGVLTQTLAQRLDVQSSAVRSVQPGWTGQAGEESFEADAVVLACPAHAAARLIGWDTALRAGLDSIPTAPLAVVSLGLPTHDWTPPQGFGCLIPRREGRAILGALFTGSIFPSHSPQGGFGVRVLLGGALNPIQASLEPAALLETALEELSELLGPLPAPITHRVERWPRAIPQYVMGHLDRIDAIQERAAAHPGLFLVGNYMGGVGMKDCIREGRRCAERVGDFLA